MPAEPDDGAPSLVEIADAIDPGPLPALTVGLPTWLDAAMKLSSISGDPHALLRDARAELDAWYARGSDDDALVEGLLGLARALAFAERAAGNLEDAPPEALLVLARIYDLTDAPKVAADRSVFGRMIQVMSVALAQHGGGDPTAGALDELAKLVVDAMKRSGALHRRVVAALLRTAPDHPEVPDVLARLAPDLRDEDEALAVGTMRRSVLLRGDAATAEHWLSLAELCYRALDLECGTEARNEGEARASKDDAELTKKRAHVLELARAAHDAVELADAAGLEDGLARGDALMLLTRHDEAAQVFETLHRRHPEDARPVVGMASVVLSRDLDFVGAWEILERARPTEHRERIWYEMSIGVRATTLIYNVLPQVVDREPDELFDALRPDLERMREDIDALVALGSDDGRVLQLLYELGMEAWPKARDDSREPMLAFVHTILGRVRSLQAEIPDNRHAYTLLLAAAELSDDRAQALAVLDVEPPAEHAEALAVRRARAAVDLVAAWDADDRVETMLRLVDAIDVPSQPLAVRRLVADAHVLAHDLGHGGEDRAALARRYDELLVEAGSKPEPVLLNNATVARAAAVARAAGHRPQTDGLAAAQAGGEEQIAVLNDLVLRALGGEGDRGEALRDSLRSLTESGGHAETRWLAQAWLVHFADDASRKRARAKLQRMVDEQWPGTYRPRPLPRRGGVVLRGSFKLGLGYSTVEGMQIGIDLTGEPWLVVPCPVEIPEPSRR